jgi:hypothetical protein
VTATATAFTERLFSRKHLAPHLFATICVRPGRALLGINIKHTINDRLVGMNDGRREHGAGE